MKEAPTCGEQAGAEGDGDLLNTATLPDPAPAAELNPLLAAARGYLGRGLVPIRLGNRAKKPLGKFEDNTVTADNAAALLTYANLNLGLRLGADGGGLVDYDLDWPEARQLADLLLFNLPKFGRATARGSHRLVRCKAVKSKKFDIPEMKGMAGLPEEHAICVLEVRAAPNSQTMVPPSVHPNGEAVEWERDMPIPEDSAEGIHQKAGLLAFLSVCARFYPGQGSRDDFCMAMAGALLAAGLPVEDANRCTIRVAEVARDEEAQKRGKAGQTATKADEGEPVTGIPRVVEMLGLPEAVAGRFRKWLGVSDAARRDDDRAQVVYDGNRLHETMAAAEDALIAAAVPIYRQAGRVVRAARLDEAEDEEGVRRPAGALLIRGVKQHSLRATMTSVVNFVSPGEPKPIMPHISLAQTYLEQVAEGGGRLPVLRGIVECPTLRPDGTILSDDGYDRATGLILDKGGVAFDPVPDEPTREDALAGLERFKAIIRQFPFVGKGSRSVALSGFLTAVCRRSLPAAPMHGFSAPAAGTGKSLLCDCIAMLAMGRPAAALNQSGEPDGEEERKALMSILMQGDPVVMIDNIARPVTGSRFCTILTQGTWQDRQLGVNDNITVSTRTLWLANGNNLEFREDISRRAILCTMDAGVEKPEERGGFELDLKVEVPRRRGELVAAGLTILRAFIVAGRPGLSDLTPFASFEAWSDLVRGALVWLGEDDPCATRVEVSAGDSVREELSGLMEGWAAVVGVGANVTAGEVLRRAHEEANKGPGHDALLQALEAACPRGANPKAVTRYLKRVKGRIVGGQRIVVVAEGHESHLYRLEPGNSG
jgi:hypothetical protein